MGYLFYLIVFSSIILITLPIAFRLIFVYLLGFSKARIKIKHPFKFVGLLLELSNPIWGIQSITIYVPEILIKFDTTQYKICIIFDRPRIILTRNKNQLLPIKIIDGVSQNHLLYNLITILKFIKESKDKLNKKNKQQNKCQDNGVSFILSAIILFILSIAIQFIQVKVRHGESAIVSSMPKTPFTSSIAKDIRLSIALLQCFAQYLLFISSLKIKVNIHQRHQINISIFSEILKLYTAEHMENNLITSQKLMIKIRIPLSFSIQQSLRRLTIYISMPTLTANSTPVDFENLSNIVNQFIFQADFFQGNTKNNQKQQIINESNQNQEVFTKIVLIIQNATIKMTELCQPEYDTSQALKYLSNVEHVLLKFQKIKLNQQGFKVDSVNLTLHKYQDPPTPTPTPTLNQPHPHQNKQLLKIDNLLIKKQSKLTNISHNDIKLTCQKQQLALLGKLFTLINSRLIKDQYQQRLYLPFIDLAHKFSKGNLSITETISTIAVLKNRINRGQEDKQNDKNSGSNKQSQLIYSPRQIQLQMDISQLVHKITLNSSQYRQLRTSSGQIIHQLTFKRILLDHQKIKQFCITDFRLQYRQAQTSNQLNLQIADIQMVQNINTLKDYLVGFTMFKMLLQFSTDQQEDNNMNKVVKAGKKSLNFTKISINYANQLLTLRKLSVSKQTSTDGKLSDLYLSLGKCNFSTQNLTQQNKKLKYPLNPSHNILSISSITLKQFLTSSNKVGQQPKQKFMIHIKNPIFLLPEINIEYRLLNYLKTFNKLQPNIQAFIRNTTDQKIKIKCRKYKIFMTDINIFVIKITNLVIGIQDTVFDRSMLNKMRFQRQYLSRRSKYNQTQVLNYLKQTTQQFNLFQIQVQCISIDIKPLPSLIPNQKSVKDWSLTVLQKYKKIPTNYNSTPRLIRANNFNISIELTKLETKIRDYPFNIANISQIKGNLEYLKTKNIYEETQHYLIVSMTIDEIQVEIGLNLLSGLNQIYQKLQKFQKALDQYKNTDQFLQSLLTKKNLQLSKFKPYWYIMHKSMDWFIDIEKQSKIKIRLLTGLTPYSKQSVDLELGKISFISNPIISSFSIESLELYGNNLKIFQLGKQTISLQSIYNEPDLNLNIKLDVISQNSTDNSQLKDNRFRISQQITKQLWKIKQLRTDWLLIYGLVEPYSKQQQNVLKRQSQSNYIDLLKLAINIQLQNRDKKLSIFSVLKQVNISCHIDKFILELADASNQIDLIINNFTTKFIAETKKQKWKMRYFILEIQNIIGRLKVYKKKHLSFYSSTSTFLQQFNLLTDLQISKRSSQQQQYKQIFLISRYIKLQLNQYVLFNQNILYILKKLTIGTLKIQFTQQLKKIIDALVLSIFANNQKQIEGVKYSQYFRKSSLQKFRQLVVLVIRANRKNKKVCNRIKILFIIKCIQVGFKTTKRLLLLTSTQQTTFTMNTTFHQKDLYRIDPKLSITCTFSAVEIWININTNNLWVFGRGYSPNNTLQAQRLVSYNKITLTLDKHQNETLPYTYEKIVQTFNIQRFINLHLECNHGSIQLTHENISALKQIGQILISLVDTQQQKKKQWKAQKDKYSEMISQGRDIIQNKLIWKYTDLSKQPPPILTSKVYICLDQIQIILMSTRKEQKNGSKQQQQASPIKKYPFMNLISSSIETKISVYNQSSLSKQFNIHNLTITNCLESHQSNFKILFQMNHIENLAVKIEIDDFQLSATDPKIAWNFYKKLFIHFNPVKIKLTQQLYTEIYHFFFGIQPNDKNKQQQQQLSNILPDYYLSLLIDQFKVQAWYRTSSVLKRLEGVHVGLEKFQLKELFLNKKGIFDKWVKFVIKQLASQFFNVIGQKIFG